jgi:hypothetical protein
MCQARQRELLRILPVATYTPSIFQKIHVDIMIMGRASNGHKLVVAARDTLTRWLEARVLRVDNGKSLNRFILEEIIRHWGCPT